MKIIHNKTVKLLFLIFGISVCLILLTGCEGSEAEEHLSKVVEDVSSNQSAENAEILPDINIETNITVVSKTNAMETEATHQLPPEDDPDYHLELLRLPKWEWKNLEDGKVEYRGKTYKRNTYVKAVLGLGLDNHNILFKDYDLKNRAVGDAVFLIAHDTARNDAKVLMIPRDTITEIRSYDKNDTFTGETLNHIALAFTQLSNSQDGSENMAQAVSDLLCGLQIDHYMSINLKYLSLANDEVGGVTVTIPNDELQKIRPKWTKGTSVYLNGKDAELFVRYRDSDNPLLYDSSLRRMSQHREYITGFHEALIKTQKKNPNIVNDLYDLFKDHMTTDMTKGEFLELGIDCIQGNLSSEDIITIPGEDEQRNYYEYYADYEQLIPIILDLFYREI